MRETQRSFTAKLTLVAGAADATTHMVSVTGEVVADEHKYWLRPGSFCDVTIDLGAKRDAPLIPRSAARATDHGYVAYVVEGDTAKERPLTLGMSTRDGWVEVRAGLAAGDLLVVRGAEALSNGSKVHANKVTPESLNNGPRRRRRTLAARRHARRRRDPVGAERRQARPPRQQARGTGGRRR